jgi:hypothetical protein
LSKCVSVVTFILSCYLYSNQKTMEETRPRRDKNPDIKHENSI